MKGASVALNSDFAAASGEDSLPHYDMVLGKICKNPVWEFEGLNADGGFLQAAAAFEFGMGYN